jgi:phosphoribosylanthranilate isomerase
MWVKICGITTEDDALLAVALGADAIGFNFVPGSPRMVTPANARDIVRRLPKEAVTVGIFRDERPERVVEIVNKCGLKGAQLHGREPASEVRWIRKRLPFVIQAFAAGDPAIPSVANGPVDVVMIDAPNPGSGITFDWRLTEHLPGGVRLLLAGGLTPDNVAEAIAKVRPWGVDVASGVEMSPGRKDPRKLRKFIETAKQAEEELAEEEPLEPTESDGGARIYDWEIDDL